MIVFRRHRDLCEAAVERDVSSLTVSVRHDVPFTAAIGEVSGLEVDMVIAIVNEGKIVFVVIDIDVHIFVSVHVLVDL
jgi:hypothetical protein